jgi:hypothetical protein
MFIIRLFYIKITTTFYSDLLLFKFIIIKNYLLHFIEMLTNKYSYRINIIYNYLVFMRNHKIFRYFLDEFDMYFYLLKNIPIY